MTGEIKTALFNTNTFILKDHYPRRSIAHDAKPFSKQPLTFFYLLFYIPFLLVVLPFYAIFRWIYLRLFVPTSPKWSLLDFVVVYLVRHTLWFWWCTTKGGLRGIFHENLTDSQRKRRRNFFGSMPDEIQPFSHKLLCEPMRSWAVETGAKELSGKVPIWWMGERGDSLQQPKAKNDETLLLYLTGGGYMISSCHPAIPLAHLMKHVMKEFKLNKLSNRIPKSAVTVEYRKSGESPTPCALLDCLALYTYLLNDLGFDSNNIVIMGDSAGGHLVNSLIRYAQDANLPIPKAAILICVSERGDLIDNRIQLTRPLTPQPWTDQAGTIVEHPHSSYQRNQPYDVLSDKFYHMCRDTFAMHFKEPNKTLLDVYFSPCSVLGKVTRNGKLIREEEESLIFKNWPKTFLIGCYGDILFDQSTEMYRRLLLSKKAEGKSITKGEIQFYQMEGSHDPFVAPQFVFGKERRKALKALCDWVSITL